MVFCYYAHNSVWTCELGYGADTMFHRTYFLLRIKTVHQKAYRKLSGRSHLFSVFHKYELARMYLLIIQNQAISCGHMLTVVSHHWGAHVPPPDPQFRTLPVAFAPSAIVPDCCVQITVTLYRPLTKNWYSFHQFAPTCIKVKAFNRCTVRN